jgi:hypothetical protein
MNSKLAITSLLLMTFAVPALADETYYVVRDSTTKKCTVVSEKPTTTTTTTVVGDGTVYKTKTEADNAVKTTKVCTSE